MEGSDTEVRFFTKRFTSIPIVVSEETYSRITKATPSSTSAQTYLSQIIEKLFSEEVTQLGESDGLRNLRKRWWGEWRQPHEFNPETSHNEVDGAWTPDLMRNLLRYLVGAKKHRTDIDLLLALLFAYATEGTARPTTKILREHRGLLNIPDKVWNQELRTSKSRLTITAKHLKMPHKSLFTSPYGSGQKRIHPINPQCLEALLDFKEDPSLLIDEEDDPTRLLANTEFEAILKTSSPHYFTPT